ncbi:hypothetical protein TDIS_0183 [Thermosulfurimonas dismutans]|uniref:Phosphate-starvation-inducible E-like protein n=2 Tax=Thermosulfurimonas dismutans TaxID=999894 RepID=A0A179D6D4_9BACT|nr:hypothetical protein TDIS_0183 [Thermosulfurimonas dismutans]
MYGWVIDVVFCVIIFALLIALVVGIIRTLFEISLTITEPTIRLGFKDLITNVLSLIVVLELVRAFVDYFEHDRVRLEILVEVVIAFCLREMLLYIFEGKIEGLDTMLWAGAILLLIIGRTLAVVYSPERSPSKQ